jgi:hypothetical protein
MTDPDELGGSAADRRFREALREGLAAAERESQGQGEDQGDGPDADGPAVPRQGQSVRADRKAPRTRSDVFMDWAPLVVAVLAVAAIVGIALYGINGGDLGPW